MATISRTPSIYQIRHIASGKVYVGSAANPRNRWRDHYALLNRGAHHSPHLQSAWDKYGKDAFVFEIIEPVLFVEDLFAREQYWIDMLRSGERTHGYNSYPVVGSPRGVRPTDETRAKQSARQKARFTDPNERAKRSAQAKAQFADPAVRVKSSERAKEWMADPAYRASVSERQRMRFADPVERGKVSAQQTARYADPNERAKTSERSTAQWADPDQRAKRAAISKALWTEPVFRAKTCAARQARRRRDGVADTGDLTTDRRATDSADRYSDEA